MDIAGRPINELVRDDITAQVEDAYLTRARDLDDIVTHFLQDGSPASDIAGCWQHFLFSRALWRWKEDPARLDELEVAQRLLASRTLQDELARYYDLRDGVSLAGSRVHRVGNTSVILRLPEAADTPERALKLIRPEYKSAPSVAAELNAFMAGIPTRTYRFVPVVYVREKSWVLMDFIEGPTLEEELRRLLAAGSPADTVAWLSEEFIGRIRSPLKVLAGRDIAHLDLSFENLIRDGRYGTQDIALVDFRSAPGLGATPGPTIAPELVRRSPQGWRTDLYAIAALIRDALGRLGHVPPDPREQLDFVRLGSPALAFKLEVLLSGDYSQRTDGDGSPAELVDVTLGGLQAAVREFKYSGPSAVHTEVLRFAQEFLTFQYWRSTLGRLLAAGRSIGEAGAARGRRHWLDTFTVMNQLVYPSVILFVLVPAMVRWSHDRTVFEHLPALAVAGSFLLVAQRYYADILRELWLWQIDRVGGVVIRGLAFFHVVPIIGAVYSTNGSWGVWAALGTAAVAFANWRAYRICLAASGKIGAESYPVPRPRDFGGPHGGFAKRFGNWTWAGL